MVTHWKGGNMSKKEEERYTREAPEGYECLRGNVEGVVYSNEETGYGIFDFSTEEYEILTIVGTLPYVVEGDALAVWGKWVNNPKYGRQFRVEEFEKIMPADSASILRYLASGTIKGIGPKTAQRIVEKFGEETFDVLENHPDWVAQIPGITYKKAVDIAADFKEKAGMRSAMMFFREYFGAAMTVKIYQRFGERAVAMTKSNPYVLCEQIEGIGFEKADEIARSLGMASDSADRVMSGVRYILSHNSAQNGHTCLPYDKLIAASARMLEVEESIAENAVEILLKRGFIVYSMYENVKYMFDAEMYICEKQIAEKLVLIDRRCVNADISDIYRYIQREERENQISYAELQRKAIVDAMSNGVTILTGGPGTGKTTVVKALMKIFGGMGMKVALAAPTGRAAKRLSESTSSEAKTIHRMLEMIYEGDRFDFARNEKNYLDENVIVVDEASMVDTVLMCALLKAIKPGARLILIGDADQLPSVGAGNVLHDIIEGGRFATVKLTEIFRQAEQSLIVTNAHRINTGEMPILDRADSDFFFLSRNSDAAIAATVVDLYKNRLPKAYGGETINRIQVISPSRRGLGGTDHLNIQLQNALNPKRNGKSELAHRERTFRVGDRVMQIRNNYELEWTRDGKNGTGIFNGDIGDILSIDGKNRYMEISFDDKTVRYEFSLLDDLEHAYAITVHKSQGSEYPIVIIPMYAAPPMLLTRNLLYTAVTRAQKMVVVVGRRDIVETMIANDRQTLRYTGLEKRLAAKDNEK